jgi:hypothetical protein
MVALYLFAFLRRIRRRDATLISKVDHQCDIFFTKKALRGVEAGFGSYA